MSSRNNAVNRLRSRSAHIAEGLRGLRNVFRDAATERVARIRGAASERFAQIKDNAASARDSLNDAVSRSPWKAIGLGAVSGLVAGFLVGRRK